MATGRTSADGRFRRIAPTPRRRLPHGPWIAAGAFSLVLGLVAVFGSGGWMATRHEAAAVRGLDIRLAMVEEELAGARARTEALRETGGFELERIAREEYLMRAPGDEVIHLVPATDEAGEGAH